MAQYTPPPPPQYQPRKRAHPQLLVLLLAVVVVAMFVLAVVWFFLPETPEPITFSVRTPVTSVRQGESLGVEQSLSTAEEPTTIVYEVENLVTKEVLATQKESLDAGQLAPGDVQIPIPPNASPGRYVLNARLRRNGRSTQSSLVFRVTRKEQVPERERVITPKEEEVEIPVPRPKTCPTECNDYNVCTQDRCVDGVCRFDPFTPCCGNTICEEAESSDSCPVDCQEPGFEPGESSQVIIERAVSSSGQPEDAAKICQSLPATDDVDDCFSAIAEAAGSYTFCLRITAMKQKDTCLIDRAIDNEQFTACDHVQDRWLQNSCFSYANLNKVG